MTGTSVESYYVNKINAELNDESSGIIKQLLEEKRDAEQFIRMVAPKYLGVYVLDRETDFFRDIVGPDYFRSIVKSKDGRYSEGLRIYRDRFVTEEGRSAITAVLDYDSIYTKLWSGHEINTSYIKTDGTRVSLKIGSYSNREDERNLSLWIFSDEELEYRKQRDELFTIFDSLADGYTNVLLIDADNTRLKVLKAEGFVNNNIFKKESNQFYDFEDVKNQYVLERVYPDDQEMMAEALNLETIKSRLASSKEYKGNYRVSQDGEPHFYQFKFVKVPELDYIIAGFQNVDDIVENEKRQQEQLSVALAAAEQSSRAKTTFLNSMSHDIRTPMNAIIGFTALAQTHIDNKALVEDYLSKINTSSTHLLSLINDILDMSRIESGSVKLEEKPVHIPDLLHDLRTMIQGLVNSKQQNLYIDTQDVENEDIITDKLRLNQVLLNIVSNAIKFTQVGGDIIIRLTEKPCSVVGYTTYEFSIKDNGIGMSEEFIEHVFDTFAREYSSTVSGIQGSGLGMAITKNIVEMMGGSIKAESVEGRGSKFTVEINVRVASHPVKYEPIPELQGARALVIDDDINTCRSVCKMLRNIDMRPDWTASGKEAVLRAQDAAELNDEYKVYIVDYLMPDMNGIESVRRIRRVIGDNIPIIVLTAYDWSDFEKEAREAGVTAFVAKPIFMSELRDVLTKPGSRNEPKPEPEQKVYDYSGRRVLLVEDNNLNREIAATILGETGMEVDCVEDGIEAVNIINEAPEDRYDLVLMDIQMPRMDGYTATREIRTLKNNRKANIPIVAMTANAFDEDRRKAFETGMDGHIVKPVSMEAIAKTLDGIFSEQL